MGALVVFAVTFGAYAFTASTAIGWLDSPELVAAASTLGVAHPPSHPSVIVLGSALQHLPLGDLAWRTNLGSALAMAGAAALVERAAEALLVRSSPEVSPRSRPWLAGAAALVFAFSFAAWQQAVRAEVYALNAACLAGVLLLVLEGSPRALAAAGLLAGLAVTIHWYVAGLCLLPVAVGAVQRGRGRALATAALLGTLALASWLYLPLRAARDPAVNWGDPDRAGRFAWTVSARAFAKALARPEGARGLEAAQVAGALVEQVTPVLAVLAVAGAYLLLRRRETRRAGLVLAGVALTVALGPALVAFDPENPDAYGYLLPSVAALLLLAAAAVGILARLLPPRLRAAGPLLVGALAAWQLAAVSAEASLRGDEGSERYARAILSRLPPRALFATSYFETQFQLWALAATEEARPDVERVDRAMLRWPGAKRPAPGGAELLAAATRRPVVVEPGIDLPADPRLAALAPLDDDTLDRLEREAGEGPPADRHGSRRALLWHSFLRARADCDPRALARASRLSPRDPEVAHLRLTCNR